MAKMKVYELAKELEIQSKDVISFLQEKGVEVKAAQSSVEDEHIALVKKKFTKSEKAEEHPFITIFPPLDSFVFTSNS